MDSPHISDADETAAAPVADGAPELRSLAFKVAYRGEPFCGFARQEGLLTVQGELEHALSTIMRCDIETVCAGRTDAGVHARGQVVSASVPAAYFDAGTHERLLRSMNAIVDERIRVTRVVDAPDDFSARFDATWREYRYRIAWGMQPLFTDPLTWWIASPRTLDVDAMRAAAAHLLGEHDFKSFCVAASAVGKNTVRCIDEIELFDEELLGEPGLVIRIVGNAFLHSMVRTIVGTLVEVGSGRRDPAWVADVLAATDRAAAGPTAPAKGLVFWRVHYDRLPEIDDEQ